MIRTGGGPAKPKSDDPLHSRILGSISTVVVGLVNKYDSDSVVQDKVEEIPDETLASVKIPDVTDILSVPDLPDTDNNKSFVFDFIETNKSNDDKSQGDTADWGYYTPKMLQTQKSAALRIGKKISEEEIKNKESSIPQKTWSSKRRPALPAASTLEMLHKKKMKATEIQISFAAEEREEAKKKFDLEMKIKNEILKQEKIKTQLLLVQLKRAKCLKKKQ